MEGIFMYIRPEQIAEQYEMEVKSISKGRDCFLCETDLGMRALKEYRGSVERAEFLAGMLDFLKGQNIVAEQIFYTKEGEIFARDEEEQNYLLLSVFRGAECDTKSREDMVYAVRLLAGLHNATEQYPDEVPEFVKMNPNALLLLYEKHNRELRQVRNYIRGRKQKNEFEEMFMRQFAGFFEKAQAVTEQLKNMEICEELTGFCHGDYNQHNVVFSREGVAVVNFLNFSYQIRVSDLSNFVRKMMEKNKESVVKRTMRTDCAELRVREAEGDTPSRTITGYAILFDSPSAPLWSDDESEAREVIAPEAITKEVLDGCDIKFTMYHDRQLILGRSNKGAGTLEYFVDEKGVGFNLELPKSPNGDEALELVSRGDISGCSFAFTTRYWDSDFVERTVKVVNGTTMITYRVKAVTGVYDFTLAADPAYPETSVEAREFTAGLREVEHPAPEKPTAENSRVHGQVREMRRAAMMKLRV